MLSSVSFRALVLALLAFEASAQTGTVGTLFHVPYRPPQLTLVRKPTVSFNASAATTYLPNKDYSNEQLAMLWYQVGEVATHPVVTATVEPTPEPTAYAGPGEFHPLVASNYGEQLAEAKLPDGFAWGLSSSAYQ